ncbi:hypothetical protein Q3G72_008541 [Acer saccharum]|nr:hypothetical protein Q3G72_008541 [Acer saccharum]
MHYFNSGSSFSFAMPQPTLSIEEDNLIRKLLISHDPDGRWLDSEQLLCAMENIMCYATTSELQVSDIYRDALTIDNESNIEVFGSIEPLGHTIYRLSHELLCKCSGEGDLHTRTMNIFDLLRNHRWDAKVALVLAAFATSYGEFWLIMQLYPQNPLAVLVAMLKQLPSNMNALNPRFKALSLVVRTMVDVTKCIVKFEGLPIKHLKLDDEKISTTKSKIFIAAYWITRSTLICSSHIKDLIAFKPEQVHIFKFNNNCNMGALSFFAKWAEIKMHQKILEVLEESHEDNQEVLRMLFALKNDFPLKNCSTQAKIGVSELKDKIVILLVSKPEILPLEELFLLIHQTYDHPDNKKLEGSYEIVWIPISFSDTWTDDEEISFEFLSSSLPWYSVRKPKLLDSAVIQFIKEDLNFKDNPILVVLDSQGMVTHLNALDMVVVWGARAYPFSVLKEIELWEEEKWTLKLMIEEINPLFTKYAEEGKTICLYGSSNLDWIREFNAKMQEIISKGLQVELVYVGEKNPNEKVRNILGIIHEEMHSCLLPFAEIQFFWYRLESMRKSILQLGEIADAEIADADHILKEVSALLDNDDENNNGWAVFGKGSSPNIVRLQGNKLMECLKMFPEWAENVAKLGFIGALRYAIEPPDALNEPCSHSTVTSYEEGSAEETVSYLSTFNMDLSIVPHKMMQHQFGRGDRHMFSSSDDQGMLKQVQASHAPDGREFAVKPLLYIIEDIFKRSAPGIPGFSLGTKDAQSDVLDDKAFQSGFFDMLDLLSFTINKVSCEISCKCSGGGDAHATTLGIFNLLGSYAWDAKVVLAMAAFALNYGEFWVVAQLYPTNPLAKSVALLKQLPEILERADTLKSRFEALSNLIKAMLEVAKCIVEFKELPSHYISPDIPEMVTATAHIPTAVYWTIRSIVACSAQIMGLIGMGHEYVVSTSESWELSSLAHKVNSIHTHLKNQLNLCYKIIDEKMHIEAYQALVRLMETPHIDNMKVLRALIYAKDDQLPLIEGSTKRRAGLELLRRKNVLLLISDLDVSHDELFILEQMYQESRQHSTRTESQYEVVWMPVLDRTASWTEEKQKRFEDLQGTMSWYSIHHPSMVDPAVLRYVKEFWHFKKKPILVVLDLQGRVVNTNALHMMWIWGSLAFPFTSSREEALWREESWRLELLADSVDPAIPTWMSEGKYICLYGGEDIEWIRKFTTTAQAMARAAGIPWEMLYVGKSNPKEKVRRNMATIVVENLSHTLQDIPLIWFFWVRLESMWHSKMKHGKSAENDPIMQEIVTMLSFDGSDQGWAVICRGSEMAKAKGETILKCFGDYELWKSNAKQKGPIPAINDYLRELYSPHHCNRLILPGTTGSIPERIVCAECGQPMEKFIMYRCCTD